VITEIQFSFSTWELRLCHFNFRF